MRKLPRDFYTRDVLRVARELPGKVFVKKRVDTILAGKIVEVEQRTRQPIRSEV